jgi:uncharacterized protein YcsI (UPF0317 family)
MKKVFINLTIAFMFLFCVSSMSDALSVLNVDTANAKEFQVSITMDYPDAPSDLAGYKIYLNGEVIETIASTTPVTSWGSTIDLLSGNNTFEVTAFDELNQESPPGNSENFNPPPAVGPQITNISVTP